MNEFVRNPRRNIPFCAPIIYAAIVKIEKRGVFCRRRITRSYGDEDLFKLRRFWDFWILLLIRMDIRIFRFRNIEYYVFLKYFDNEIGIIGDYKVIGIIYN